ncbi:hypothetical protein [Helicobacter sp. 23-1045]
MREVALWATSWQSTIKSNPCEAPESRPLRGAKNRGKGQVSATRRFFARSGEGEALPLKAKKRLLFGNTI